jgi:regulator of protease activity HflC (stomatin/prohibitin superfamily)
LLFNGGKTLMADKINLVYIGPKPAKKDCIYNSHLVFPKGVSVPVPTEDAYKFLQHQDVWVREEDYASVREQQAEQQAAVLQAQADAETARQAELAANDLSVDGFGDLGKLSSAKLKTIVESEELGIAIGDGEAVRDFARRVRDALKARQDR